MAASAAVTPEIAAEAAIWVARLHGPDRSSDMVRECLAWQNLSAQHRLAFERCTDVWQEVRGVSLGDAFAAAAMRPPNSTSDAQKLRPARWRWALALSVAGIFTIGAATIAHYWRESSSHGTGIGEQQLLVLDDGTRMTLSTATRVSVDLSNNRRSVSVLAGEALFEVAKDPRRPFVVQVANSEVVALGTVFSVRFTPNEASASDVAITLIEGQVAVRPSAPVDAEHSVTSQLLLKPGERARLAASGALAHPVQAPRIDHPRIDQILAWRRGEALFDDAPLEQAVAEMNRYSRTPIELAANVSAARYRVSGLFRTGDNAGFARAVAALHGLALHENRDRLELALGS